MNREAVDIWRKEQVARSRFSVTRVDASRLAGWEFSGGRMAHESGGFFAIGGLTFDDWRNEGRAAFQPIVLEAGTGTVGFLLARDAGETWLLAQAKTEPGHHGGVQLAPTIQCSESNQRRRHGGAPTPHGDWFTTPGQGAVLADSVQSGPGTRCLDQQERHVVVEVARGEVDLADRPAWRWLSLESVQDLIRQDLVFNAAARSVLAVTPWDALARGEAFGRWAKTAGFGRELYESHRAAPDAARVAELTAWLEGRRRERRARARVVPLDELRDWTVSDRGVASAGDTGALAVNYYAVQAQDREVPQWTQPLLASASAGDVALVTQVRDGLLRLLVRVSAEPGFSNDAQLSASFQTFPGEVVPEADPVAGLPVLLACWTAEAGGRSFQDVYRLRIVLAPKAQPFPESPDACWLTLGEVAALKGIPGVLTHELRAALSLFVHLV